MYHELKLSWRSWIRIAAGGLVGFVVGVLALTPDASWFVRLVAAAMFLVAIYAVLDAVLFASSWRFTPTSLKVPTLRSRHREISGDAGLEVEVLDGPLSMLRVSGPNGSRAERINPLVSGRDLRRWFDAAPEAPTGREP